MLINKPNQLPESTCFLCGSPLEQYWQDRECITCLNYKILQYHNYFGKRNFEYKIGFLKYTVSYYPGDKMIKIWDHSYPPRYLITTDPIILENIQPDFLDFSSPEAFEKQIDTLIAFQ